MQESNVLHLFITLPRDRGYYCFHNTGRNGEGISKKISSSKQLTVASASCKVEGKVAVALPKCSVLSEAGSHF